MTSAQVSDQGCSLENRPGMHFLDQNHRTLYILWQSSVAKFIIFNIFIDKDANSHDFVFTKFKRPFQQTLRFQRCIWSESSKEKSLSVNQRNKLVCLSASFCGCLYGSLHVFSPLGEAPDLIYSPQLGPIDKTSYRFLELAIFLTVHFPNT